MHRLRGSEGDRVVFSRVVHALARALLMAVFVALPSLVLSRLNADGAQLALFLSLLAALFTFVEYCARYPSIVEFRDAAPFNRMRFFMAFIIVGLLTALLLSKTSLGALPAMVAVGAETMGQMLDIPFSPVRLLLIAMPDDADLALLYLVRDGAALIYAISLVGVVAFLALVRLYDWPARKGAFNVWVNLPLFDPTTCGDVVPRLRRDGYVNVIAGALLPFLIPALAAMVSGVFDLAVLFHGQTFVWSLAAWSFIPASMMMRGIAMCRVAELIEAKRRRAYAKAAAESIA